MSIQKRNMGEGEWWQYTFLGISDKRHTYLYQIFVLAGIFSAIIPFPTFVKLNMALLDLSSWVVR